MSKLQEKPSALKREHPALKKIKFIRFFLCLWVIFALLDPDPYPDCKSWSVSWLRIRIPIRIENPDPDTDPVTTLKSGSNPDLHHCFRVNPKPIISPHKRTDPDTDPVTSLNPEPIRIRIMIQIYITASELMQSPLFHHIKGLPTWERLLVSVAKSPYILVPILRSSTQGFV